MTADQLGGNIFRDFILISLVGLPGACLAMLALNKKGKIQGLILFFIKMVIVTKHVSHQPPIMGVETHLSP